MVRIRVRVRILGLEAWAWPVGFDMTGPFELGCWAKGHGTHNAPIFQTGEISLPRLEKNTIFLTCLSFRGPLMVVCSNTRVTGGFSIFDNTFNTDFLGFPQVRNLYNRLEGNGFFCATCWF